MALEKPKNIVPLGQNSNTAAGDELERSGQAVLGIINEAAQVSRSELARATDVAHKLADQLRAFEDRNKQLEAEVRHYQDRAARAEKWLARVHNEIGDKFFNQAAPPQAAQRDR